MISVMSIGIETWLHSIDVEEVVVSYYVIAIYICSVSSLLEERNGERRGQEFCHKRRIHLLANMILVMQ